MGIKAQIHQDNQITIFKFTLLASPDYHSFMNDLNLPSITHHRWRIISSTYSTGGLIWVENDTNGKKKKVQDIIKISFVAPNI